MSGRVGHGTQGFRSNLRLIQDLVRLPVYEKRVFIEFQPALEVTTWTLDDGTTYVAAFEQVFDGRRLDVVSVQSLVDAGMNRVETLTECRATPNTFFYLAFPAAIGQEAAWDDGVSVWDGTEIIWDQVSFLFVNLVDGSNPNDTRVVARLGVFFGNRAEVEPHFGPERLTNGDFEDDFTDWVIGSGSAPLTIDSTTPLEEAKSARWDLSAVSLNFRNLERDESLVGMGAYRLSMIYSLENVPDAEIVLEIETPTLGFIQVNGRDLDAAADGTIAAEDSRGATRRMIFDFIAPESGVHTLTIRGIAPDNPTGPSSWDDASSTWDIGGFVWDDFGLNVAIAKVDRVSLRRIYGFNYQEPRVTEQTRVSIQQGARDIFGTTTQIGSGTVELSTDRDHFMERLATQLVFESHPVIVRLGGAFPDGEEILIDDFLQEFTATTRRVESNDRTTTMDLEDIRGRVAGQIPINFFDDTTFPTMDIRFIGDVRRLWFGEIIQLEPVRISFTGNDYGVYELADPNLLVNGITSVDQVFAYASEDAADLEDVSQRLLMVLGTDYSEDLTLARISILADVQGITINATNNSLDFRSGGTFAAFITPGIFLPRTLAAQIKTQMDAVSGDTFTVVYSDVTHDFTITRISGGGNFDLFTQSGANKAISIYPVLRYTQDADKIGGGPYTSDVPIFLAGDADSKHIIRVDGVGTRDTVPGGVFTGVSGDPIELGTDIVRFVSLTLLGISADRIDETSFVSARTTAPQLLGIYLTQQTEIIEVARQISNSNAARFVQRGDGVVLYVVNQPGVPTPGAQSLSDEDFISFNSSRLIDDVYETIRILFDLNPQTGELDGAVDATDELTGILFGRPFQKSFTTFLTQSGDATTIANLFLDLTREPPLFLNFMTKVLVNRTEGEKIFVSRNQALDDGGILDNKLFRILLIAKTAQGAESQVIAVEDV